MPYFIYMLFVYIQSHCLNMNTYKTTDKLFLKTVLCFRKSKEQQRSTCGSLWRPLSESETTENDRWRWSVCVTMELDLHSNSYIISRLRLRILLLIAVNWNMERLRSLKGLMAWLYLTLIAFIPHGCSLSLFLSHLGKCIITAPK